jgi:hypothetical protein
MSPRGSFAMLAALLAACVPARRLPGATVAEVIVRERSRPEGTAPEGMVPFDPSSPQGFQPEILAESARGDYSLVYALGEDGTSIRTRFRGLSEAFSAGLGTEQRTEGEVHVLLASLGRGAFTVPIARWKLDSGGRVVDAWVRVEPVVEIRAARPIEPGELVTEFEWRPWIDGRGIGDWRR